MKILNLVRKIHHKSFILACALIILLPTVVGGVKSFSLYSEYKKHILIVEGESPIESNFAEQGGVSKSGNFFGRQALELDSKIPPEDGFWVRYQINVAEDGEYNIFVAGTPPGPSAQGSEWHSPYSIAIDDGESVLLTEEKLKSEWPHLFKFNYSAGGYYFTKVLTSNLAKGSHVLTFRLDQRRRHDGHFTAYLDAFIVARKDFHPKTNVGRIPKEMFDE